MNTLDSSQIMRFRISTKTIRFWIIFGMVIAFVYTALLQPYIDLLSVAMIRAGRPQLIPLIFYLKPICMLALILIFYVRWTTTVVSAYFIVLALYVVVFAASVVRDYANFSEFVVMIILLALAFRPVNSVSAKLQERLFKSYIVNLVVVVAFGFFAYVVFSAAFWSDLNLGQVELYKSGAARAALTQNFYGATFGQRIVSFWGEPLAFGYSVIPLFFYFVVKYRQTRQAKFVLGIFLTGLSLLLSTRLAFGVSVFTAGFYWLHSYPEIRRYFPIFAIPFIMGTLLLGGLYLAAAYYFDPSTRDRIDLFRYFAVQVNATDLLGLSIGKFTNYNPQTGYQEAPEFGVFRFVTGLGLPLAILVIIRYSNLIWRNLAARRSTEIVMACSLLAYMLSIFIAPQFFTIKTLYPFAAVWFLVMAPNN